MGGMQRWIPAEDVQICPKLCMFHMPTKALSQMCNSLKECEHIHDLTSRTCVLTKKLIFVYKNIITRNDQLGFGDGCNCCIVKIIIIHKYIMSLNRSTQIKCIVGCLI
jgi:membrane-bound acyltransferase YfiQ involved in biofilm formation